MLEPDFRSLHSSIALFSVFPEEFLQSLSEHKNHVFRLNSIISYKFICNKTHTVSITEQSLWTYKRSENKTSNYEGNQ